jgi:PAS domain-containing protein
MADSPESEDKTKQLRLTPLKTATSVFQIRQRAEQEIRRTNEALERRTRELAQAFMIMRATLESTTDAIVVVDEKGKVTDFNGKYIDMWKIPQEVLEGGMAREVRELACQNFADPQRFLARVEGITATDQESLDQLELKDSRSKACWREG